MTRWPAPIAALFLLLLAFPSWGQVPVLTAPNGVSSSNSSGTITVTNTFQQIFASAIGGTRVRQGCLIQNNGSNTMWVFAGPLASATKATSYTLIPPAAGVQGGSFSCSTGAGSVLQDQISITGTATETFTAAQQ